MQFTELSMNEYDAFVRTHPYRNFLNAVSAFEVKKEQGFSIAYVGVKEGNQVIAATGIVFVPVMRFFKYAYAQRGYLLDYDNLDLLHFFHDQIVLFCKKNKVTYIKLDPMVQLQQRDIKGDIVEGGFSHKDIVTNLERMGYHHQGYTTGFQSDSQVRFSFVLNLKEHTEESLLKQMDQQTRWSVNKTIKMNIKVRELKEDELSIFKKMMDYASSTRNFENMSISYYQQRLKYLKEDAKLVVAYLDVPEYLDNMKESLHNEQVLLNEIEDVLKETPNSKKFKKKLNVQLEAVQVANKRIQEAQTLLDKYGSKIDLAGAFFIRFEDELYYVSAGAYDEFRNYNGPYAIHWYMLRYAMEEKITKYNFYGVSGNFNEDADDHGVFAFKQGFGGVVEEYIGEFIFPVKKGFYNIIRKWQHRDK